MSKIIIVDDESDAFVNFLPYIVDEKDLEYKLFQSNPLDAVEYAQTNKVDAAFLDIIMPTINGVELARRLIKAQPGIKIVFISGYTQNEQMIKSGLGESLLGFCYKPYEKDVLLGFFNEIARLTGKKAEVFIRTFGAFELLINGRTVRFMSKKSKELLAALASKNGAHLVMDEAIAMLWPDKNPEQSKILYRDAVWRLRGVLQEQRLENTVGFLRGQTILYKDGLTCDYWDFLDGINTDAYAGSFLPTYEWAIDIQNNLDIVSQKLTAGK